MKPPVNHAWAFKRECDVGCRDSWIKYIFDYGISLHYLPSIMEAKYVLYDWFLKLILSISELFLPLERWHTDVVRGKTVFPFMLIAKVFIVWRTMRWSLCLSFSPTTSRVLPRVPLPLYIHLKFHQVIPYRAKKGGNSMTVNNSSLYSATYSHEAARPHHGTS